MRLIIIRGISGSGKSTLAKDIRGSDSSFIIVNRDSIRHILFGSEEAYGVDENLVTEVEHNLLTMALSGGYNVVSDNTNINIDHVKQLVAVARDADPAVEIDVIVMETSLADSLRRNASRERTVPEEVILVQYKKLLETKEWTI